MSMQWSFLTESNHRLPLTRRLHALRAKEAYVRRTTAAFEEMMERRHCPWHSL